MKRRDGMMIIQNRKKHWLMNYPKIVHLIKSLKR